MSKSTYDWDLAVSICNLVARGNPLTKVLRRRGMPGPTAFLNWRRAHKELDAIYQQARQDGADALADEMLEIADRTKKAGPKDHASVNAARLRVETRRWICSKLKPWQYGDKVDFKSDMTGEFLKALQGAEKKLVVPAKTKAGNRPARPN